MATRWSSGLGVVSSDCVSGRGVEMELGGIVVSTTIK